MGFVEEWNRDGNMKEHDLVQSSKQSDLLILAHCTQSAIQFLTSEINVNALSKFCYYKTD